MKLHEVKLSSQKPLPYLQRMFDFVKGFKPNVKLNDIARLCAKFEVEMGNINVRDEQTLLDVLYDGIPPLKDNPTDTSPSKASKIFSLSIVLIDISLFTIQIRNNHIKKEILI